MRHHLWIAAILAVFSLPTLVRAQALNPGKNTLQIRGVEQTVDFYPSPAQAAHGTPKVLFAPGDFGMHGPAIAIAEKIASWGYDVYALDTRRYVGGFSQDTALRVSDVMSDFRQLATWVHPSPTERIVLVGWSEGAGLCLLAAVAEENKQVFSGIVVFGLTETNALAWHWSDLLTSVFNKQPKEPKFESLAFLPKVAPLPLVMIQSTGDQYVSVDAAKHLYAAAKEPKRFVLIEAQNHRFDGNQQEFYRELSEGLQWVTQTMR